MPLKNKDKELKNEKKSVLKNNDKEALEELFIDLEDLTKEISRIVIPVGRSLRERHIRKFQLLENQRISALVEILEITIKKML